MRVLFLAAALVAFATQAYAHAQLRHAEPAAGSTVKPPSQVELTFSEAVEPKFCTVLVTNAAGQEVDQKNLHVPGDDAKRLVIGLGSLAPGQYKVVWHATSVDTHKTEGSFGFTVSP